MRYALATVAILATVNAQKGRAPAPNCTKVADIKPIPDPFYMFSQGQADFPCDMGTAIPFGPVPAGCANLELIIARGTTEPGPFGTIVGDPLVARVQSSLRSMMVQGYAVQYPAASNGSEIGVADIPKRMQSQIAACPGIKFALAGYSQGGSVTIRAVTAMQANLTNSIVAIALYGAGNGSYFADPIRQKTIANCAPGDFACPDAGEGPGHVSYNNQGTIWHDRSAQYIVQAFNGTSLGAKLMRSPTDPLKK